MTAIPNRDPAHIAARETLVQTRLDLGEPAPARYYRLFGRLSQDFDRQADLAAASHRHILVDLPQDWNTRSRLTCTPHVLNQGAEARQAAEQVAQLFAMPSTPSRSTAFSTPTCPA